MSSVRVGLAGFNLLSTFSSSFVTMASLGMLLPQNSTAPFSIRVMFASTARAKLIRFRHASRASTSVAAGGDVRAISVIRLVAPQPTRSSQAWSALSPVEDSLTKAERASFPMSPGRLDSLQSGPMAPALMRLARPSWSWTPSVASTAAFCRSGRSAPRNPTSSPYTLSSGIALYEAVLFYVGMMILSKESNRLCASRVRHH
mmetsp:Transcript_17807/g.50984  ORF Transcript_17807/g.50984 Transcript_17807/m.50984 type:complete len:202 (-) Transcript_17807:8-613(-)